MTMLKALLLLLITYSFVAHSQVLTYADFATMDKEQQVQVVKIIHRFLADDEANLTKEKLSPKAVQYLLKLFNTNAYANNSEKCLWGGWKMDVNEKGQCKRPTKDSLGDRFPKYPYKKFQINFQKNTLKKENKSNECKKPAIVCHPIFGADPICIDAGYDTYNTSFACMQAAKQLANKDQKYYEKIVENVLKKPDKFLELLQDIYDMCLCGGQKGRINQGYSKKVGAQRTCGALLTQIKLLMENGKGLVCEEYQNDAKALAWAKENYKLVQQALDAETKFKPEEIQFSQKNDAFDFGIDEINKSECELVDDIAPPEETKEEKEKGEEEQDKEQEKEIEETPKTPERPNVPAEEPKRPNVPAEVLEEEIIEDEITDEDLKLEEDDDDSELEEEKEKQLSVSISKSVEDKTATLTAVIKPELKNEAAEYFWYYEKEGQEQPEDTPEKDPNVVGGNIVPVPDNEEEASSTESISNECPSSKHTGKTFGLKFDTQTTVKLCVQVDDKIAKSEIVLKPIKEPEAMNPQYQQGGPPPAPNVRRYRGGSF